MSYDLELQDLRLVRDKFTHVSRGFAFVHFHMVSVFFVLESVIAEMSEFIYICYFADVELICGNWQPKSYDLFLPPS